jgi:hypothetical protein
MYLVETPVEWESLRATQTEFPIWLTAPHGRVYRAVTVGETVQWAVAPPAGSEDAARKAHRLAELSGCNLLDLTFIDHEGGLALIAVQPFLEFAEYPEDLRENSVRAAANAVCSHSSATTELRSR